MKEEDLTNKGGSVAGQKDFPGLTWGGGHSDFGGGSTI